MRKHLIQSKKNYELLMDSIIELIKERNLKPGDKLDSIEKLSTDFGVSRSVVREALSGLKAMGLIDIQQGEGTFIKDFDPTTFSVSKTTALLMKKQDIKELIEVRKILEVGAVKLAALNRTDEDLTKLEKIVEKMSRMEIIDENIDFEFHYHIVQASKNNILIHLLQSISELMIETIRDTIQLSNDYQNTNEFSLDHQRIFTAIKKQDEILAEKYMVEHLSRVEEILAPFIK